MSSSASKLKLRKVQLPPSIAHLPQYWITPMGTSSREDQERTDVAFGVRSLNDLAEQIARGFADPDRDKPSGASPSKRRR